jgi:hypothetical protein|nr:MAG: hypothetical protein [Bacteriophage sp.]
MVKGLKMSPANDIEAKIEINKNYKPTEIKGL